VYKEMKRAVMGQAMRSHTWNSSRKTGSTGQPARSRNRVKWGGSGQRANGSNHRGPRTLHRSVPHVAEALLNTQYGHIDKQHRDSQPLYLPLMDRWRCNVVHIPKWWQRVTSGCGLTMK